MSWKDLMTSIPHLLLVVLLSAACSAPAPEPAATVASAPEPTYWPTEGWRTSTPEEQGMDSERLADMLATMRKRNHGIDSVLIVRNGFLVLEANVSPFTSGSKHDLYSCTKSFVSTLVGMALEEGMIESVEQPVLDFFPERRVARRDADKEAMTLEDLLTMRTGLDCHDSDEHDFRGVREMWASDDWVQHVLDLPMLEAPGTRFEYCNQASFLLSAILRQTTGMSALTFAEQRLFGPLGISDVSWPASPQGINIGYGDMSLRPTDMAKFGYLYLNQGVWDGAQVVPSAWVEASTRKHVTGTTEHSGYGYQWWIDSPSLLARLGWTDDPRFYLALGYAGQYIVVVPERNMVVVFAGSIKYGRNLLRLLYSTSPLRLLNSAIIKAAESSEPLPANRRGLARMESLIAALERPGQPKPVPPLPEMAHRVSGKTFQLDDNPYNMQSFSLRFQEKTAELLILDKGRRVFSIGLDDVYRYNETNRKVCKGHWSNDHTFVIDVVVIGHSERFEQTMTFEGDEVSLLIKSVTAGEMARITGRRED